VIYGEEKTQTNGGGGRGDITQHGRKTRCPSGEGSRSRIKAKEGRGTGKSLSGGSVGGQFCETEVSSGKPGRMKTEERGTQDPPEIFRWKGKENHFLQKRGRGGGCPLGGLSDKRSPTRWSGPDPFSKKKKRNGKNRGFCLQKTKKETVGRREMGRASVGWYYLVPQTRWGP